MKSINLKYALLGQGLELRENVTLKINENNHIDNISSHTTNSNLIALPGFYNAHVHAADIGIRGEVGTDLQAVVGPEGTKIRYLNNLTQDTLKENIKQSIVEGLENGIMGFVDFREAGLNSYEIYDDFPSTYVPHIRVKLNEFDLLEESDREVAIGVRDVIAYEQDQMEKLSKIIHDINGRIEIHASEDPVLRDKWQKRYEKSDIIWAIDVLRPHAIVHATLADDEDIKKLAQSSTGVILCPTSNQYFGVGKPPVDKFLKAGIKLGLGSDNAMVNEIALWKDMRLLRDWGVDARDILQMATVGGGSLSGVSWGITKGNSHFLVLELPPDIKKEHLFEWLISEQIMEHVTIEVTGFEIDSIL